MKKQIVIIGIVAILIIVGLGGCQESQTSGDTNKVQLVDYIVETYYNYGFNTTKLGDGFVHNNSHINRVYMIQGTIKNTAGEILNNVVITLNFYDNDNNFLALKTYTIRYLSNSGTETFYMIYYDSESYFDKIDEVKFTFITS